MELPHQFKEASANASEPEMRLYACITSLTRSGKPSLDEPAMRELKTLCRSDEKLVERANIMLYLRLGEPHAQIRYSAFQIFDQLFRRSRIFRCLALDRFERLVDSVLIVDEAKTPPPKPLSVFKQLGDMALEAFIAWHDQFSVQHPKLVFLFRYVSEAFSARMAQVRARLAETAAARQSEERRLSTKKRELLTDTEHQFGEEHAELSACLATIANCLSLLVPSPEEFDVNPLTSDSAALGQLALSYMAEDDDDDAVVGDSHDTEDEQRRLHGIVGNAATAAGAPVVSLRLCRPSVRVTPDNAELVEELVTRCDQLRGRSRPRLARWLAVVQRCEGGSGEAAAALRRRLADLLAEADRLLGQAKQLHIVRSGDVAGGNATGNGQGEAGSEADDEDDDNDSTGDFEVVEKEGFEAHTAMPHTSIAARSAAATATASTSASTSGATTARKRKASPKPQPSASVSSSASASASASAPVVLYGIDLANWGCAGSATFGYRPDDGGHAFGYRPPDGDAEFELSGTRDMLTMRTMVYSAPEEPIRWACRHPLPRGGLCQRMDRAKCPFHGPIVPRDETGQSQQQQQQQATASTSAESVLAKKSKMEVEDKKPAATSSRQRGRRVRSSNPPASGGGGGIGGGGLVDIRALKDNPRTRLAARVASKAALRRVEADELARRRRKAAEKFGDQFQYQFLN